MKKVTKENKQLNLENETNAELGISPSPSSSHSTSSDDPCTMCPEDFNYEVEEKEEELWEIEDVLTQTTDEEIGCMYGPPIEPYDIPVMYGACTDICKYNTGDSWRSANYGYSD